MSFYGIRLGRFSLGRVLKEKEKAPVFSSHCLATPYTKCNAKNSSRWGRSVTHGRGSWRKEIYSCRTNIVIHPGRVLSTLQGLDWSRWRLHQVPVGSLSLTPLELPDGSYPISCSILDLTLMLHGTDPGLQQAANHLVI